MILFNRYKNTQVERLDELTVKITANMCDTFHEINMVLTVDIEEAIIKTAEVEFIRQPDEICRQTANLAKKLVGLSLGRGLTSKVKEILGGPTGCTHLADLVLEAAKSFVQGRFRIQFEAIGDRNKAKQDLEKKLAGNCWYHSKHLRENESSSSK